MSLIKNQVLMSIRTFLAAVAALLCLAPLSGQTPWVRTDRAFITAQTGDAYVMPHTGDFYQLDFSQLVQSLQQGANTILLPDAQGQLIEFDVQFSRVAEPGYYQKHPMTGTYKVRAVRDASIHGRIDHTLSGFHAMIRDHGQVWMIDPVFKDRTDLYASYLKDDYHVEGTKPVFECEPDLGMTADPQEPVGATTVASMRQATADLLRYRLAMATTGEYASFHGGTVAKVSAELITLVNRLNEVYEIDLGAHLDLIANNDDLIFLDPATDGYTNGSPQAMLQENPNVISAIMPSSSYDIGHVLGTALAGGTVGLASLASVCTGNKARAMSSLFVPKFDPFYVDIVAHEFGHQFAAQHSFNKCDEMNENPSTGWEPGSGSTIMSYSGSCGINNVQDNSGAYFHGGSLEQMKVFVTTGAGAGCANAEPTANEVPTVSLSYTNGFTIPISTPFKLHAEATDANNDNLTYCWEQMDTGPITDAGSPVLNSPLFRSFDPTSDSMQWFPQQFRIIQNFNSKFELLPTYTRDMNFRVTVRDNNPEVGAIARADVSFKASDLAGPFTVAKFNTVDTVRQGEYVEVTWNVANTDVFPVNCKSVNIKLSTDGGYNFPYVLASNVPNNGSFFVTMPIVQTTSGRIMVEAADNIFYDINNANLRILPPTQPTFAINVTPYEQVTCIPDAATITIDATSLLGFTEPVTFEITSGLPPGAVANWSANPATPTEQVTLSLDLSGVTQTGLYELVIEASAAGAPTQVRNVFVDVYRNDYSSLDALSPASGTGGISVSPLLTWVDQADADTYTVEVATSPAFGASVVATQSGLTTAQYQVTATLLENTLYFWRVIPSNPCGTATDVPVYAFHTLTISCDELTNNTEYTIASTGLNSVESIINVPVNGPVGLVRVKNILGNHQNIGNLRGNLKGPDGKTRRLWNPQCSFIGGDINMGFNDDSQATFACPPDNGDIYKSVEPLADFTGDPIMGDWSLIIQDIQTGAGGKLTSWTLEFCTSVALNAPYLVTNDTLRVKPAGSGVIDGLLLLSQDADNAPAELVYTVVNRTQKGDLTLNGSPLGNGGQFTQADIDGGALAYSHNGTAEEDDSFTFTVEDGNGGWFGIERFAILTSNSVSTLNPDAASLNMSLWPNPAKEQCTLMIPGQVITAANLMVINTLGQQVPVAVTQEGPDRLAIQTTNLTTGLYYVQVAVGDRLAVSKLQISAE